MKMKNSGLAWSFISMLFILSSCIKNDIPFPYIPAEITEIEVKGQIEEAKIDASKRTIIVTVDDLVELDSLVITKLVATPQAVVYPDSTACKNYRKFPNFSFSSLNDLPKSAITVMNLTKPVPILLQTYQNYPWTLSAKQVITRTIEIDNQVGEPVIDELNRIAVIYVSSTQSLSAVTIHELKLAGRNSVLWPDPTTIKDFTRPQHFKVFRNNRYIGEWTVDIIHTSASSSAGSAEVWAKKATVSGGMKQGASLEIEYKKSDETVWATLPSSAITITSATTFNANLTGLEDGTTYQWRVVADGISGAQASFTTEKIAEIPNLNFDTWIQSGKNWYANPVANNLDDPQAYWATGNEGVTSSLAGGNDPITQPVEGADAYKGKAARLNTITGVSLVGSAAGNLFIGTYKTNMTKPSSSVSFGRSFNGARPTKLTGYYKYISKPVNSGNYPGSLTMDECHIYVKIWDASGNLFAYGEFIGKETVTVYTKFTIPIEYKDLKAKPDKITIVTTSSRYGGEFEGAKVIGQVGNGSTLWVDEFELLYD